MTNASKHESNPAQQQRPMQTFSEGILPHGTKEIGVEEDRNQRVDERRLRSMSRNRGLAKEPDQFVWTGNEGACRGAFEKVHLADQKFLVSARSIQSPAPANGAANAPRLKFKSCSRKYFFRGSRRACAVVHLPFHFLPTADYYVGPFHLDSPSMKVPPRCYVTGPGEGRITINPSQGN